MTRIPRFLRRRRFYVFLLLLIVVAFSFYAFTKIALTVLAYTITFLYLFWGIYNMVFFVAGLREPYAPTSQTTRFLKFSLILPAVREPLIERTISHILFEVDYPKGLKELMVVADDEQTGRIALRLQQLYPRNVKLLLRRQLFPTKPSALDDAVTLCTGDVIGVVDAEDILENDLLKKVNAAVTLDNHAVVQAILRISNVHDSWITRIFACEYAGWFRVLLNGRSRLKLYAPLGGTGNYIRADAMRSMAMWNPLNLAEDAELALRLHLNGYRTVVINGRHWEEAPVTVRAWLRQRTRWFRGWLQSLFDHGPRILSIGLRHPKRFLDVLSIFSMLVAPLVVVFNWVAYSMTALYLLELFKALPTNLTADLFPVYSWVPLAFNAFYLYVWYAGKRLERIDVKYWRMLPQLLFYMNVLLPVAALRALYQEIFKDVFWEKTAHPGRGFRWTGIEVRQADQGSRS
jgi:cellulose synthase/poly-beta-1,6-N-acetylglucosamine synthase-like glycosyltransferase